MRGSDLVRAQTILLASLLLAGCIVVPPSAPVRRLGEAPREALDDERIRVLTWNVYKGNREGWSDAFERLAASHDLLLLQEAYLDETSRRRFERMSGLAFALGVAFRYGPATDAPETGTMLGCRARPVGPIRFSHSPFREALTNTPKSHIAAELELDDADETLLAVSVHATNLRLADRPFEAHVDQILERVSDHRGPVVVAGDFNTWNDARTSYLFDRAASLGLESLYDPSPPADGPGDGRMIWTGSYLDHAFVRGLAPESAPRVLATEDSSDHRPLSFTLRLPRATELSAGTAQAPGFAARGVRSRNRAPRPCPSGFAARCARARSR